MEDSNISREMHDQICKLFEGQPVESGGIAGSSNSGETITHVVYDNGTQAPGEPYSPDEEGLNLTILTWLCQGIQPLWAVRLCSDGEIEISPYPPVLQAEA